jgi:hypothetical protein
MTPSSILPEDTPHWARPRLERQIDMLGELAEAGLVMALDVKDEAQALKQAGAVEPVLLESLSRAFGRTARAVRLTLMLQERLIKGLVAFDERGAADALEADDSQNDIARIIRIIVDPRADIEDRERQSREAAERLDHERLEDVFPAQRVDEQIATIRQDLGLDPDGSHLAGTKEEISLGAVEGSAGRRPEGFQHEDHEGHKGLKGCGAFVTLVPP